MGRSGRPLDLIESTDFEKQKNKLLTAKGCERLDEVLFGIDLKLCQKPDQYPIVQKETGVRMFVTEKFRTVPAFRIWYRYDTKVVELLYIELAESRE